MNEPQAQILGQRESLPQPQAKLTFQTDCVVMQHLNRAYYGTMLDKPKVALDAYEEAADEMPSNCTGMVLSEWMLQKAGYPNIQALHTQMRQQKQNDPLLVSMEDFIELFGPNAVSAIVTLDPPKGTVILDAHTFGPLNSSELSALDDHFIVLGPQHPFIKEHLKGVDLSQFEELDLEKYAEASLKNIIMIRPIGAGHFSQAWFATPDSNEVGTNYVVQGPKRKNDGSILAEQFKRAKKTVRELQTRGAVNIVKPVESIVTPDDIMITHHIAGDNLEARIPNLTPLERLKACFSTVMTLVADIHLNGFTHGDIKPENFFGENEVLGDFSEAKEIAPKGLKGLETVLQSKEGKNDWQHMAHVLYTTLSGGKLLPIEQKDIPLAIRAELPSIQTQFPPENRKLVGTILTSAGEMATENMFSLPTLLNEIVPLTVQELQVIRNATAVDLVSLKGDLAILKSIYKGKNPSASSNKMRERFITPAIKVAEALLAKQEISQEDITRLTILAGRQEKAVLDPSGKVKQLSIDEVTNALKRVLGTFKADSVLTEAFYTIGNDCMWEGFRDLLQQIFQYKYQGPEVSPQQRKARAKQIIQAIKKEYGVQ